MMITASQHFRSQHGEDQWLHEHWSELGLPANDPGYFFEAGAADGETFSNTYWLEHEREWVGMLCEPDPRHVLLQATRPGSVIERCAVGPRSTVSLGLCADPFLSGELREDFIGHARVEQFTISWLLEKHCVKQLDLLSLDTEGTELAAFESLDLSRWRPRICIIELETWGLASHSAEMLACMDRNDYEMVHRTRCNGIFICTR